MRYTPEDGFPYYFDFVKDDELYTLFSSSTTFTFLKSIIGYEMHHFKIIEEKYL